MLKLHKTLGLTFDDVLLVPQFSQIQSRDSVDVSTQLTPHISLKIPVISANMDTVTEAEMAIALAQLGGIGFIHRFLTVQAQVSEVKKVKKKGLLVGAAVGVKGDFEERAAALIKAGVDVIVIDIAHGHSQLMLESLSALTKTFPKTEFIAGNVATPQAAQDLIKAGAAAIKIGIGPGALCTTRIVAGAGIPQLTAIDEISRVVKGKVPLIADGGIRNSGDIVKALAVGGSTVMIGTMLAGCEESPAKTVVRQGKKFKMTRGMASTKANSDRQKIDHSVVKDLKHYAAEGVEALVPYRGTVTDLIEQLISGLKSGLSYSGAHTIQELQTKAEFIQITQSSLVESKPHDVHVI